MCEMENGREFGDLEIGAGAGRVGPGDENVEIL